jgi:ubiquinone/menaquinone biosynthesis C-methylase UbiE
MTYQPDYKYIPPINKHFLTPIYDRLCSLGNFGLSFRRKVIKLAKIKDGDIVVDVGCGTGVFLQETGKQHSVRLIGIDPDKQALAIAQAQLKKAGIEAELHESYAERLPLADNLADIVASSLAFHHMPDAIKRKAAQEIYRILKPGGRVIIADFGPNRSWIVKLLHLFEKIEYLEGNIKGLIPVFLRESGFRNVTAVAKHFPGVTIIVGEK